MRIIAVSLTVALMFGYAEQAVATDTPNDIEMVNGWAVSAMGSTGSCIALKAFTHRRGFENSVFVTLNAREKNATVGFSTPEPSSLEPGAEVNLKVVFLGAGGGYDDGWGMLKFDVDVPEETVDRNFVSRDLNKSFLDDFAKNTSIGFFYGENIVSAFNLEGSAAAVTALRTCSFRLHGLNPNDPFLK